MSLTLATEFTEFCQPNILCVDICSPQDVLLVLGLNGKDVFSRSYLGTGAYADDGREVNDMLLLSLGGVFVVAEFNAISIILYREKIRKI